MACVGVDEIIDKFSSFTQKPVKFLNVQDKIKDDIKNLVKTIYDYTKTQEEDGKKKQKSALPELIVKDFDEEQIWQELELQNSELWDQLVWDVSNSISNKDALKFPVEIPEEPAEDPENSIEGSGDERLSDEQDRDIPPEQEEFSHKTQEKKQSKKKESKKPPKSKGKASIVDDQFFKLQEMEKFLLKEEKNENKDKKPASDSDEESIDMFDDIDDGSMDEGDDDEKNKMMYDDFFDENDGSNDENEDDYDDEDLFDKENQLQKEKQQKIKKKVKFSGLSSDDSDSDVEMKKQIDKENDKKSDFELRQQRLQQTITRLEEKTLKDAPWQLKGEIDATKRPQNSLLEEVVDFDLTTRPAPIITEETTLTLEDIIKRRIKDKAWDDVERKEKPVDDQLKFRKTEILDQSKSKLSLAQVYEAEYLKQKQALSGEIIEEKEPESHKEIREAMSKLFSKLDALSHYHYTPKPAQAEVKIVTNTPAISMEEVAPIATSEAALLAPEEIRRKRKGELLSKEERSVTDKNRERRKKKKLQRKKGQVQKVTDVRNTKKGTELADKSIRTSKAFFQQLNDNATSVIKKNAKSKNKGQ